MNQDFVAWVAQGTVTDRPNEHLGESDRGVIMLRRKLQEQMAVVADGGEPMGVFRDPEKNRALKLPLRSLQDRRNLAQATAPSEPRAVSFQVGEPPDALEELRRVASTWADPRA
jgi:5,5'-dehydrodivanillate O-demethylase